MPEDDAGATINIEVRVFGVLREYCGSDVMRLDLPCGATVADAVDAVVELVGVIQGRDVGRSVAAAVNRTYARADQVLDHDDVVALLPPVSGGSDAGLVRMVQVTDAPLDLESLQRSVADARAGAVVTFQGVTRDVDALDYEAYIEMASELLETIAREEAARCGALAVAAAHRVGRVALGESSVVVVVASAHRGEAFDAARAIIDRLKVELPIWKREIDGAVVRRVDGVVPGPRE